jgi:hypothetical protein
MNELEQGQPIALPVTYKVEPTGRVQLARTGSGFWRRDHGAPFSVDEGALRLLLRNTQIRRRPIRVDFMHWANCDLGDELGDYAAAGELNPFLLQVEAWLEPATQAPGFGIFGPGAWTPAGWSSIAAGIDEISPVIDWAFVLPEDTPEAPAGTVLGPTIIGASLVDRGFFWMDKVRLYSERPQGGSYLYQEQAMADQTYDMMERIKAIMDALQKAGVDEGEALVMLEGYMKRQQEKAAAAGSGLPLTGYRAPASSANTLQTLVRALWNKNKTLAAQAYSELTAARAYSALATTRFLTSAGPALPDPQDDPQAYAQQVSAYRDAEAQKGRKITQAQAIKELGEAAAGYR